MAETIEDSLRSLISSLQLAKIYPLEHPKFKESLENAHNSLRNLLKERNELVIGIIGEELAFEKEIFFDLSKSVKPFIQYLKERGIERIAFTRGITKEELSGFIIFLITPKDEIGPGVREYLLNKGIKNIAIGKIKAGDNSLKKEVLDSVNYLRQYEDSLNRISVSLDAIVKNEAFDYPQLKYTMGNMMENLFKSYQEFLKLAALKRHDISTFVHLLNTAVLSMYFSFRLGFNKDDVLNIGMAALFHDIGKIYVSGQVIKSPDKLSDEEFEMMKSHTELGSDILLRHTRKLGVLPAIVAFEHHLRYDLRGYPKLYFTGRPHIASLIVSLCDVYDALNARRSYKKSYPPEFIYSLMLKEKGKMFEPQLLEKLFMIMGVWPVGAIVSLTDKSVAIVREENEDDIFYPKVEVVFPFDKSGPLDLRMKKEELKIEYALDAQGEGKKYYHLV